MSIYLYIFRKAKGKIKVEEISCAIKKETKSRYYLEDCFCKLVYTSYVGKENLGKVYEELNRSYIFLNEKNFDKAKSIFTTMIRNKVDNEKRNIENSNKKIQNYKILICELENITYE